MIQVAYINTESKIKINGILCYLFTLIQGLRQGCLLAMLLCIIVAMVLAVYIGVVTRIKGIQIEDHEIKIVNFIGDTNIFSGHFSCLTKIKSTLALCEKASRPKINFLEKIYGLN